jgi:hypothetical protein
LVFPASPHGNDEPIVKCATKYFVNRKHRVKFPNINIFMAWLLIPQTLAMGWVAFTGSQVLQLFGLANQEEGIPGRIVGLLILVVAVFAIRNFLGGTLPIEGNPSGNGYRSGHRLIFAANLLAATLFIFQIFWHVLPSPAVVWVLASLSSAFGYWVMAMWAVGFSFIYQSSLFERTNS